MFLFVCTSSPKVTRGLDELSVLSRSLVQRLTAKTVYLKYNPLFKFGVFLFFFAANLNSFSSPELSLDL